MTPQNLKIHRYLEEEEEEEDDDDDDDDDFFVSMLPKCYGYFPFNCREYEKSNYYSKTMT